MSPAERDADRKSRAAGSSERARARACQFQAPIGPNKTQPLAHLFALGSPLAASLAAATLAAVVVVVVCKWLVLLNCHYCRR